MFERFKAFKKYHDQITSTVVIPPVIQLEENAEGMEVGDSSVDELDKSQSEDHPALDYCPSTTSRHWMQSVEHNCIGGGGISSFKRQRG